MVLFPFVDYWSFYVAFVAIILVILTIDLGVFNREAHQPSFREASLWTLAWVVLAALFNVALYFFARSTLTDSPLLPVGVTAETMAGKLALEFLTGYVVEKTLAIDNIFVFAMVFTYFQVPVKFQHKILFWGIIGALVFRALFIALGSYLMQYHSVVILFGILLIGTGLKMIFQKDQGDPTDLLVLRLLRRFLRIIPDDGEGKFLIRKNNLLYVTPLFLALVVIEISDIVFAIDSVPAIFALTKEPLIVFTSNILAILGLRSLYFMICGVLEKFKYIKYGLAGVLVFVGLKMAWLNQSFDGKFPLPWSLGIIVTLIGSSVAYSIIKARRGNSKNGLQGGPLPAGETGGT